MPQFQEAKVLQPGLGRGSGGGPEARGLSRGCRPGASLAEARERLLAAYDRQVTPLRAVGATREQQAVRRDLPAQLSP